MAQFILLQDHYCPEVTLLSLDLQKRYKLPLVVHKPDYVQAKTKWDEEQRKKALLDTSKSLKPFKGGVVR